MAKRIFVAATRQHVGKTTTSLGILKGLFERTSNVGFIKPVGQQHLLVDGVRVDKDVALMKRFFNLKHELADMSPVLIPQGYTRKYIDGEITGDTQLAAIHRSMERVGSNSDVVLLEGTGHTGVGSVVDLNNAQVAAQLDASMVLVANGGLGSAYDDLELNRIMCKEYGVRINGVVLNKVLPSKMEMVQDYFTKLMRRWDVPLLGVVPDKPFLGKTLLYDIERLLDTKLIAGERFRMRHYNPSETVMIPTNLRRFLQKVEEADAMQWTRPLFVTHVSRSDIILGYISHFQKLKLEKVEHGGVLVLTGPREKHRMLPYIEDMIKTYDVPVMHASMATYSVMQKMETFTPKLTEHDFPRVQAAAEHYSEYLDFNKMLR